MKPVFSRIYSQWKASVDSTDNSLIYYAYDIAKKFRNDHLIIPNASQAVVSCKSHILVFVGKNCLFFLDYSKLGTSLANPTTNAFE